MVILLSLISMDWMIELADKQASTSWEEVSKIDETKLLRFIEKTLIWSHFHISNIINKFYLDMTEQGKSNFYFLEEKC